MGQRVNKKQLSIILGKSERTISEWQGLGLPMILSAGRGKSNEYDTAAVIQWLLDRASNSGVSESARDRRERLQGDLIEAQLAEKAGEVVPAAEIEKQWAEMVQSARSVLLSMADKLKVEIDSTHNTDIDVELINEHVNTALSKLAAYEPQKLAEDDQEDHEAVCSPPETNHH